MSYDEVQDVKLVELERRMVKLEDTIESMVKKLVAALLVVVTAIFGSHQVM
tara:strand:+ start:77 stop:229 length:153 start_codon:yes stop_codon:yes gene_type:complete